MYLLYEYKSILADTFCVRVQDFLQDCMCTQRRLGAASALPELCHDKVTMLDSSLEIKKKVLVEGQHTLLLIS